MAPIRKLEAKGYGCLSEVSVPLSPLHAFIGPNDSGKSTILRAVRTAVQLAVDVFSCQPEQGWAPFDPAISEDDTPRLGLLLATPDRYEVHKPEAGSLALNEQVTGRKKVSSPRPLWNMPGLVVESSEPGPVAVRQQLQGGARLLRLDPDALRRRSGLIPEGEESSYFDDRGLGLPGVYDAIQNRGDDSFQQIAEQVRKLFPTIKHLRLRVASAKEKELAIELRDGTTVPAAFMSEGLLYYLAFAAIPYLAPTSVLLIEEPENGLHPARIRDVVRVLREISNRTQVLLATHSPLIVNELRPEEVTVTTRHPQKGTQAKLLADTPNFEKRAEVYALGELWIAYADGDDEAALLRASDE